MFFVPSNQVPDSKPQPWASNILQSPNQDLKDMDVLSTFKIKIESRNLQHWHTKEQWLYRKRDQDAKSQSGTSSILISPKAGLKGHWCSLHLQHQDGEPKFRLWLYQKPVTPSQDAKPQWGTSSILQSLKWGLKGHGCSLHLQNQDREPKFCIWVYQRPVTISKSISGCQTPVRNLQRPPKPQMRT